MKLAAGEAISGGHEALPGADAANDQHQGRGETSSTTVVCSGL